MLARRPFGSQAALLSAARDEWFSLAREDWLEAFSHHPKIGDREALRERFAGTRHLSEREQSGVNGASDSVLEALAAGNHAYEKKFGHIFIVCATGKSATEMLGLLRSRLGNDPDVELRIAAAEQAKITEIRLTGLSADDASRRKEKEEVKARAYSVDMRTQVCRSGDIRAQPGAPGPRLFRNWLPLESSYLLPPDVLGRFNDWV
jgi:2-oxo-4-hydroxy-4-carboxy-5-ureidoimidazoline decarboxylase